MAELGLGSSAAAAAAAHPACLLVLYSTNLKTSSFGPALLALGREYHALTYIHSCPRCAPAAVRAVTNCILWSISVDDLAMLLEDLPGSPQQLCRAYMQLIARLLVTAWGFAHIVSRATLRYAAFCS